jgi:hypothetical protein
VDTFQKMLLDVSYLPVHVCKMAAAKQLRCLVTGGASGLGRATVQRLIQKHGAKAVILDLPSSNGEKVAEEIGKDCYFCPTDVSAKWCRAYGNMTLFCAPHICQNVHQNTSKYISRSNVVHSTCAVHTTFIPYWVPGGGNRICDQVCTI